MEALTQDLCKINDVFVAKVDFPRSIIAAQKDQDAHSELTASRSGCAPHIQRTQRLGLSLQSTESVFEQVSDLDFLKNKIMLNKVFFRFNE